MLRLLSQALHEDLFGEVHHFDFLFIRDSENDHKYVFIFKDYFSGYTLLNTAKQDTAEHAAEVLS